MKARHKGISRTIIIILVLAVLVVASVSIYLSMPKTQPSTTQPGQTTATTTPYTTSTTSITTTTTTSTSTTTTTSPTTTSSPTTTYPTTTTTTSPKEELKVYSIEGIKDILNIVKHIKYKYEMENKTEGEHYIFSCAIDDKGDEIINGQQTRKIEYEIFDDGETEKTVIWVSKQDWETIVKASIDGEEVEPYMLPYLKFYLLSLFIPFMYVSNYRDIWAGAYGIGVVQLVTVTQITYGETTLKVSKYKFTPSKEYQSHVGFISMEYDLAQLIGDTGLITGYKITFPDGSYYLYEVQELTRP